MNNPVNLITLICCALSSVLIIPADSRAGEAENCITLFYKQKPEAADICTAIPDSDKTDVISKIIGDIHYWGWGNKIDKDYKKAITWYKRAAAKDNKEAAYNLGVMYENGFGVPVDYTKSVKWYRSAAKKGHRDAQFNLANMYSKGAGIALNQKKAAEWYLKAANRGEVSSQYNLGNRYAIGNGVNADLVQSYKWYSLASINGDEEAKKSLDLIREEMDNIQIEEAKILVGKWRPEVGVDD